MSNHNQVVLTFHNISCFWFPRVMMSEKRGQKFHTDDASPPDLGIAYDWTKQMPTNQKHYPIWVMTSHQHGISVLVSQTSLRGETRGAVGKCRLLS